jgi:8-oxo-dGTP pyrophosphatase MutT (NUDIX family)
MYKELPIKVELIVFVRQPNALSFLLLKRTPEDGGFWQPITGTLEIDESIRQCISRELQEETGIGKVLNMSEEIHRFSWQKKDYTVVEMVYGVEVSHQKITLSPEEHSEYRWCSFDEAIMLLEKENNKNAFLSFKNKFLL